MSLTRNLRTRALIAKGKVKQRLGRTTRNAQLEDSGRVDEIKGNVKKTGERIKDVFKK